MKTKAAVLTKLNSPLEIIDLQIPKLQRGHVLVKVDVAGICGSQKLEIKGWKNNKKFLPHMMGHEGCGIVYEIGPEVTKVIPGHKVVLHWRCGTGIEAPFVKYGNVGSGKVTTFSQFVVVSENRITPINSVVPPDFGALLGCAFTTAYGAAINDAQFRFGNTALVIGCGGVGRTIVDACLLLRAKTVSVADINYIKNLPHGVCNITETDIKYDYIFDTVCNTETMNKYIANLTDGGKYIAIGQGDPNKPVNLLTTGFFGKSIIFSQGGNTNPDKDIPWYIAMYLNKDIQYKHLISHRYPLESVNEAIDQLSKQGTTRVLLDI